MNGDIRVPRSLNRYNTDNHMILGDLIVSSHIFQKKEIKEFYLCLLSHQTIPFL